MEREIRSVPDDELESAVEQWVSNAGCPGASVAIVDGDETIFQTGVGKRHLDPGRPATPETLYCVGSATKPLTATAVLTLVERGEIALEDPVSAYVPHLDDAPGDPITIHELLSHSSGMPHDDVATCIIQELLGVGDPPSIDGWEDFEAYVAESASRRRTDDDQFQYYNSGYAILARVVESVAERSFPQYVETAVFDPLGMDDATFDVDVLDAHDQGMTAYAPGEDGFDPVGLPDNPIFQPPGGLIAPVTDLATFLSAAIGGGEHLDDSLRERMYTPAATVEEYVDGTTREYGYGWFRQPFGSDTLLSHSGGTFVSAGYVAFLEDRGLGVAIGANAQGGLSPRELVVDLLCPLTEYDPVDVRPKRAIEQKARAVTGRYESYRGLVSAEVNWTGNCLELEERHQFGEETTRFAPASLDPDDHTWVHVTGSGGKSTAEFTRTDDGIELCHAWRVYDRVGDLEADGDDGNDGAVDAAETAERKTDAAETTERKTDAAETTERKTDD